MKVKKILIVIVSAVFLLMTIGCLFGLFSLRKVEVTYAVSDKIDAMEIQEKLDGFVGDSLVLFDTDKVEDAVKDFYYVEVYSVEKSFPNVLKVCVRERKEIYYVKTQSSDYAVITKDGFVLRLTDESEALGNTSRDKIVLNLDGVTVTRATVGERILTDSDSLVQTVFDMAKSVELTDCIKTISVFKPNVPGSDVTFETYTGVKIEVAKVENKGVEMVNAAFDAYNSADSDYVKMYNTIKVHYSSQDNKPVVNWTNH